MEEVSPVHHHLHQEVSDPVGHQLDAPRDNPVDAGYDEDTVPHPEDGKDFVIYHVEREDTDGSLGLLTSSPAIPLVVTHSHYNTHHHNDDPHDIKLCTFGKHLTHWIM